MKERRKSERFKALLDAEYTKVEGRTIMNSLTTTRNISLGGLCMALGRMVKRQDELLVELDTPCSNEKLAALAKVVWVRPEDSKGQSMCGLKFLWVSSQTLLEGYLAEKAPQGSSFEFTNSDRAYGDVALAPL